MWFYGEDHTDEFSTYTALLPRVVVGGTSDESFDNLN